MMNVELLIWNYGVIIYRVLAVGLPVQGLIRIR